MGAAASRPAGCPLPRVDQASVGHRPAVSHRGAGYRPQAYGNHVWLVRGERVPLNERVRVVGAGSNAADRIDIGVRNVLGGRIVHIVVGDRKVACLGEVAHDDQFEGAVAGVGHERQGIGDAVIRAEVHGVRVALKLIPAVGRQLDCIGGQLRRGRREVAVEAAGARLRCHAGVDACGVLGPGWKSQETEDREGRAGREGASAKCLRCKLRSDAYCT
jgi:hypothetical protein